MPPLWTEVLSDWMFHQANSACLPQWLSIRIETAIMGWWCHRAARRISDLLEVSLRVPILTMGSNTLHLCLNLHWSQILNKYYSNRNISFSSIQRQVDLVKYSSQSIFWKIMKSQLNLVRWWIWRAKDSMKTSYSCLKK